MPSLRTLFVVLSLLCLLPAAFAQSAVPAFQAMVGPAEVQIPSPAGFNEASAMAPSLRQLGETNTPPSNRLLAFFVADADLKRVADNERPSLSRYFMVQTLRSTERDVISTQGMREVKDLLRTQYKSVLSKAQPQIESHLAAVSQKLGAQAGRPELNIKVGELLPLDIFDERTHSISFAALSKVTLTTDAVTREVPLVVAMTTLTVRGKLLYFYAYSVYDGPDDVAWARTATTEWLSSLR
jgi:hypothetical protein